MALRDPQPSVLVPPHSIEAEQAVLGSILLDSAAWDRVAGAVGPPDFYRPDHRLIFEAMGELVGKRQALDVVTVFEHLKARGGAEDAGGLAYLASLARDTPTAANAASYAGIVRERAALRGLISLARTLEAGARDGGRTAQDVASATQERLIELQASVRRGRGLVASGALVSDLLDDLDRRASGHRGLSIGLADFDAKTGGLDAGDLIVIAGRPAMGKTALLITIAATVAQARPAAVFSAEMPSLQLMRRCLAKASGISQRRLRHSEALADDDWKRICDATPAISALRLHVDDTPAPTLAHIRAESASLKARDGLGLVLVDYLQLVRGAGRNRYEELREVAYGLKALAKDLAVPVIALAQLNRDVEKRGDDKRPSISDLRDSGAIEEAADIIGMLYREGYYDQGFAMPYVLECNIVKHRNGELGGCLWNFAGDRSLVSTLDEGAAIQYRRLLADRRSAQRGAIDL